MKKKELGGFPTVSIRDLGKKPGAVIDQVLGGERLIVCRHGVPVATLQPLTGYVLQPGVVAPHDIAGDPLADVQGALNQIPPFTTELLRTCRTDVIKLRHEFSNWPSRAFRESMDDLVVRGLARRTHRGMTLTGLGLFFKDELIRRVGHGDPQPLPWNRAGGH
jgi:antitoxin (DNA-binding transcriptional repressor) of toxin-antitoxin stability system